MDPKASAAVLTGLSGAHICTWDWDPHLPEVLGLRCAQAWLPENIRDEVSDRDWVLLRSFLSSALHKSEPFQTVVKLRLSGSLDCELAFRGGSVHQKGQPIRVGGICWRKEDSANALESFEQTQWAMLTRLSHELRSPLTANLHLASEMYAQSPPPELLEAISEVDRNGRFMLRVIEDVLDAFRSGGSKSTHEPEVIATEVLVDQLIPWAKHRAAEQGLSFELFQSGDFPQYFCAEPIALRRILQNLLDNALKFTRQGEVKIALSKRECDAGSELLFTVTDTGPGIAQKEIERIFLPFEQGSSVARTNGGLGLGLALSRQLAYALKGTLDVDSQPGRGSRFSLRIAFYSVGDFERHKKQSARNPDARVAKAPLSVLLVEDHPLLSKHTQRELSGLGCRVNVASNGQEALALLEQSKPDVIILDLDLPDMSGYDLCRRMLERDSKSQCRYVAYSGSEEQADRQAAAAAGFHDFFVKPSSAEELLGLGPNN